MASQDVVVNSSRVAFAFAGITDILRFGFWGGTIYLHAFLVGILSGMIGLLNRDLYYYCYTI